LANPILRLIGNFAACEEEELRATQNKKWDKINKIFTFVKTILKILKSGNLRNTI